MKQDILVRNGFIAINAPADEHVSYRPDAEVATLLSNLASYGYTLDRKALDALIRLKGLGTWWRTVETILKDITGANRKMDDHVVYKNFPKEVLDMTRADSIFNQIMIYHGVPYDCLREEEDTRPPLGKIERLKVLTLADETTPGKIFTDLKAMPNRWSDNQTVWAKTLFENTNALVMSDFGFKENGIVLAAENFEKVEFVPSSATDVLRLCAVLSKGDVSLREKVKFRTFSRSDRRRLLAALDEQKNIADDFAMRPEQWKRVLERLHPGDYKFANVQKAYDALYNKTVRPFSALVDPQVVTREAMDTAATRPGEFLRRFHYFYSLFGEDAVTRLCGVVDKLTTRQLAGLRAYLRTINDRATLIYPPKSNWARAQIVENTKTKLTQGHRATIEKAISGVLSKRLAAAFPEGVALDMRVDQVRLQTNDQKLAEYGRGTEFDIPSNITFLRSASYWEKDGGTTWYDNGWNFFDENWKSLGCVAWNEQYFGPNRRARLYYNQNDQSDAAAIFSGDPVNSRDLKGRACQMADVYLDRLEAMGVGYAVWNILCYSKKKFSEAKEVLATLQMGDNPETGKLYEPSRAQMVFPLKSDAYTSYVAYVDVKRRKLVYMDAPLKSNVSSASANSETLEKLMPAYVEYLASIPTLLDVLQDAPAGDTPILYEDSNVAINDGRAFVFVPTRPENTYRRLSVTDVTEV